MLKKDSKFVNVITHRTQNQDDYVYCHISISHSARDLVPIDHSATSEGAWCSSRFSVEHNLESPEPLSDPLCLQRHHPLDKVSFTIHDMVYQK